MDEDNTQPSTQKVLDPRRLGRNNSGLSQADISDVLCILHPCSHAALRIVARTAQERPQHVLQNNGLLNYQDNTNLRDLEEQDTFILDPPEFGQAQDLALRFSSATIDPVMGFCFGRNQHACDIFVDVDAVRRVSNRHFRIFVNNYGILMLEDTSTNGTLVDDTLLKSKGALVPATRTLQSGAVIQILSPRPEEEIKFILRIPTRDGYEEEYMRRFQAYRAHVAIAHQRNLRAAAAKEDSERPDEGAHTEEGLPFLAEVRPPMPNPNYGMQWNGGNEYNVIGLLGKGAFATVYQLATIYDGQPLAAKELEKKRFIKNGRLDQRIDNEMQIMKGLRHPNIVQYIDYVDKGSHIYIIMEYVPCGDLQGYLQDHGPLPEAKARVMACQLLQALVYLHKKKITHRDIKPDNVLIACADPFTVKLSDFGLSKVVKNNETFLKTFCGTLLYCAPEVFPHYDAHAAGKRTKHRRSGQSVQPGFHSYSQSVDIWSFAAVLWFSMCEKPPFEGVVDQTGKAMFNKIMGTSLDTTPLRERGVSEEAIDLLKAMLNTDPARRPTEYECLRHPWLADLSGLSATGGNDDLNAIAEEDEEDQEDKEYEEANDVLSQLVINDRKIAPGASHISEVDLAPSDLDFLDQRQSKRIRADYHASHRQATQEPVAALNQRSTPELPDPRIASPPQQQSPRQNRLFGEIGLSALQSSRVLGDETNVALSLAGQSVEFSSSMGTNSFSQVYSDLPSDPPSILHSQVGGLDQATGSHQREFGSQDAPDGAQAAASLLGAESMVRELNMASPQSVHSAAATPNEPSTPQDTESSNPRAYENGDGGDDAQVRLEDIAPKRPSFNRQIHLSLLAPDEYDLPSSEEAIDLQEAPREVGGKDALTTRNSNQKLFPLPDTIRYPDLDDLTTSDPVTTLSSQPALRSEFLRPNPRLGKLTSTRDSFTSIVLRLDRLTTAWGRNPNCTIVYADNVDTRIPKLALTLTFHGHGIEQLEKTGRDWTKLTDLHTYVSTGSRHGIWVNDVQLKATAPDGRVQFGRLYTGDVIKIFGSGKECLKFECEFYHGEAAKRRPPGSKFKIEKDSSGVKQFGT